MEIAQVIKDMYTDATVRLEYCPDFNKSMHIDILVIIDGKWIPIELKYKTKLFEYIDKDGCVYNLKDQSAYDNGCYDYLKDITRIESVKEKEEFEKGYTIFITNDPYYYNSGPKNNSNHFQFSLKDDRDIKPGELKWVDNKKSSVTKERNVPLKLNNKYAIKWEKYAEIEKGKSPRL